MKYTEDYKKSKSRFSAGFYLVVACCLILIGGSSWFALSKIAKKETVPENLNSSEYRDNTSSYNESTEEISEPEAPAEDVAQNVSKEPYSGNNTSSSTAISFTMPVQGRVIKDYSNERLQYSSTFGDMRLHEGVDIECEKGTAVSACADGKVASVTKDASYGTLVIIEHYGYTVKYASLDNVKLKEGDTVKMGDIIGNCATVPCECNDKSHIHIEVFKNGKSVSPLKALGLS